MTPSQRLEIELEATTIMLEFLNAQLTHHQTRREHLIMELNRARRLEREELQK